MNWKTLSLALAASLLGSSAAIAQDRVWLDTDLGPIFIQLDRDNTPVTSQNFLDYVEAGYYDGLVFHRVINNFVIQAGGFDRNLEPRTPIGPTIPSESSSGGSNQAGTIAMALRGNNPDSGQNEFYINLRANPNLDAQFTVFGNVVYGASTMAAIRQLGTATSFVGNRRFDDVPTSPPAIRRASVINGDGFPIMPGLAGSWFDRDNPGFGFNVEIAQDIFSDDGARLVVYWYDYINGEQLWLAGNGSYRYGDTEVTMDLTTWDGFGEVEFQAPAPGDQIISVGSLTVRFTACDAAEFDYEITGLGFASGVIPASRLSAPESGSCPVE